jgi:ribonuclease VapC
VNDGYVFDASVVLALLLGEPGSERVKQVIDGAVVGSVNLAEVVSYYAKQGAQRSDIESLLRPLPLDVVSVDASIAYEAGMLRRVTVSGGLSLGDRYCLALARLRGQTALTADRRWSSLAEETGVEIELIR